MKNLIVRSGLPEILCKCTRGLMRFIYDGPYKYASSTRKRYFKIYILGGLIILDYEEDFYGHQ
jgi:hypothetical protein